MSHDYSLMSHDHSLMSHDLHAQLSAISLHTALNRDVLVFLQTAKTQVAKPASPVTNRTDQFQSFLQPSIQLPTAPPKVFATPPPPSPVPGKIPAAPTLGKTPSAPLMGKPPAVRTSRYTDIPLGEARRNQASSVAQWKVRGARGGGGGGGGGMSLL